MTLSDLGWDDFFASSFQPYSSDGFVPARVVCQHKHAVDLLDPDGELAGVCTGRLLHQTSDPAELPSVGDWVAVRLRQASSSSAERVGDIHAVLARRTQISRGASGGEGRQQLLAANIDTLFLATGLDSNFNLRRIERYVAVARASGAQPVVVLTKADLHPDPSAPEAQVRAAVRPVPVVRVSAQVAAGEAGQSLSPWLLPGSTVALLGSSGVGKSTLINRLLGEERQSTRALSAAVNKGVHTTTRREMLRLPCGAWMVDTPGLRELQLWGVDESVLDDTFPDIAALVARCRFHDCTHTAEPGCAVVGALESGELGPGRWASYQKLGREQAYAARRSDPNLARAHRERWKKIHRDFQQRCRDETRFE